MKSHHTYSNPNKLTGKKAGKSSALKFIIIIVASFGLALFLATQLMNREQHASDRSDFSKDESKAKPKPPIIKATEKHHYDDVTVAAIDARIANNEHAEGVEGAGEDDHKAVGEKDLDVRMPALHDAEKEAGLIEGRPGKGLKCPTIDMEALDRDLQIPLKHLPRKKKTSVGQKYDRRAHNCAGDGIWNRVTIKDHHAILQNIARLGRIQQGSFVFDWGSGCGHQLEFLTKEFGCNGVGVDVSSKTIDFARANTSKANLHCVADGTKLEWIPTGYFDHAYSFGSIYHVYNRSKFCHILRQMVRIVKPGGTVYNGWTENAEYRREHVGMCLADLPVKFTIYEEALEFKDVKIFPLKLAQTTPNTYSLVITKALKYDATYDEPEHYLFSSLPVECGVHKCEPKDGVVKHEGNVEAHGPAPDKQQAVDKDLPKIDETEMVVAKEAQSDVGQWSFEGWPECPAYDPSIEDLQIPLEHLPRKKKTSVGQKYDRRAGNCAGNGVWHKISIDDHKEILETIGKTIEARKDDIVFDWGSGCGHQLEFMFERFGARGLGIDVSNLTVAYAANSTVAANRFCVADGNQLDWIPSNFFDKAFSFGSIYHVYDSRKFCSVLRQMVRIVKPGGIVYNGWTENEEFHRDHVVKCVNTQDDSWLPEKERNLYKQQGTDALNKAIKSDIPVSKKHQGTLLRDDSPILLPTSVKALAGDIEINADIPDNDLYSGQAGDTSRKLSADHPQQDEDNGDGVDGDHIVEILPEKDLFSTVKVFPLKARRTSRTTYSVVIRKSKK
eukprot:GILI01009385.1.p1 GENE.GILI01009385.1~~GILI01009385.1.p1  ORF type:complete len:783 (-),score=59.14 GILI01009385.1:41-2389(-)